MRAGSWNICAWAAHSETEKGEADMRKKRIAAVVIMLCLIGLYGARVYAVNADKQIKRIIQISGLKKVLNVIE